MPSHPTDCRTDRSNCRNWKLGARTLNSWTQLKCVQLNLMGPYGVHDLSDNVAVDSPASRAKDMEITFQEIASSHPGSGPLLVGQRSPVRKYHILELKTRREQGSLPSAGAPERWLLCLWLPALTCCLPHSQRKLKAAGSPSG